MKAKGKIFQIIKWEEKKKYFHNCDCGNIVVDLLYVGVFESEKVWWHDQYIFGLFKSFLGFDKPIFKYENMVLDCCNGLPVLVERPHDFKVGDRVEVEISLKKDGEAGGEKTGGEKEK